LFDAIDLHVHHRRSQAAPDGFDLWKFWHALIFPILRLAGGLGLVGYTHP
jgi:hypothetical protein